MKISFRFHSTRKPFFYYLCIQHSYSFVLKMTITSDFLVLTKALEFTFGICLKKSLQYSSTSVVRLAIIRKIILEKISFSLLYLCVYKSYTLF